MNKKLVGGLAIVIIAAGVLTIVTAARMSNRGAPQGGSGGSTSDGQQFVHSDDWKDIPILKDFQLTERSGKLFDSKKLDGQVWVASFFFASCPHKCRLQNEHIGRLHRHWGPKGVTFVSITCDPTNDTPPELQKYARKFDAHPEQWQFLTGEMLHIRRIGGEIFQVPVQQGFHDYNLLLVDRWGKLRGHFDWKDSEQLAELEESIGKLLDETEPPSEKEPERPKFIDENEDGLNDLEESS